MTGDISVIAEEIRSAGFGFAPAEQFRALLTPAALAEFRSFAASWENLGVDAAIVSSLDSDIAPQQKPTRKCGSFRSCHVRQDPDGNGWRGRHWRQGPARW